MAAHPASKPSVLLLLSLFLLVLLHTNGQEIIRLTDLASDGLSVNGSVELLYRGMWRPLCGRGWHKTDADVVCKTIGFRRGAKRGFRKQLASNEPKRKNWYYMFYGLRCHGTEESVTFCHNWDRDVMTIRYCSVGYAMAQCKR